MSRWTAHARPIRSACRRAGRRTRSRSDGTLPSSHDGNAFFMRTVGPRTRGRRRTGILGYDPARNVSRKATRGLYDLDSDWIIALVDRQTVRTGRECCHVTRTCTSTRLEHGSGSRGRGRLRGQGAIDDQTVTD